MKFKDIKKGIWNINYSLKATAFRATGFPHILPKTTWLAITYKCNSRCKMCSIWKRYKKEPEKIKDEMTFKEFAAFINKNKFLRDIALSGGEPFLQPDLNKMFLYLDRKGYATGTATNAIMKDFIIKSEEELLSKLSGRHPHGLEVSIDGLFEEHDRVRGTKGLFDRAVEIVKWGIGAQKRYPFFSIVVSHTITSHNYKKLLDFVDFFVGLGLKPEQISFRTAQIAKFYGNEETKEVPLDMSALIKQIKKVQAKYEYFRKNWFYANMINYLKNPKGFRIPCYAAISFCYIDPYWDVYPCTYWAKPIGNLRKANFDLKKIWKSKEARIARKCIAQNKCPNCWTGCNTIPSRMSDSRRLINYYLGLIR
jgi:MoaA/NifB/PqqE/SkfB family radical SAM enzyme